MNFSLGVQQQAAGTVVDVSYAGSLSRHLYFRREINPIPMFSRFDPKNEDPTRPGRPLPDVFLRPLFRIRQCEDVRVQRSFELQFPAGGGQPPCRLTGLVKIPASFLKKLATINENILLGSLWLVIWGQNGGLCTASSNLGYRSPLRSMSAAT